MAKKSAKQPSTTGRNIEALDLLEKTKKRHGGITIDAIKMIKSQIVTSGVKFKVLMDWEKSRFRIESLEPSFSYVEQLDGNSGWVFGNGELQDMSNERIAEIKRTLSTGIFGPRKDQLENSTIEEVQETSDNYLIVLQLGNERICYALDKNDYTMEAILTLKNQKKEVTFMSDFKKVDAILLPFTEITEAEGVKSKVVYNSYQMNVDISEDEWSKPN